jgi:hypothetical protein
LCIVKRSLISNRSDDAATEVKGFRTEAAAICHLVLLLLHVLPKVRSPFALLRMSRKKGLTFSLQTYLPSPELGYFSGHYVKYQSRRLRRVDKHREVRTIKANSHMPCRAHAVPLPCRAALTHTCHAVPLPFSDSAVSFVKVRVVAGNIRTSSPTV